MLGAFQARGQVEAPELRQRPFQIGGMKALAWNQQMRLHGRRVDEGKSRHPGFAELPQPPAGAAAHVNHGTHGAHQFEHQRNNRRGRAE